ncbi:MAG: NAD(P)H-dependent oxidoreductase [Burkholderiaceae bacterium]|jgi:chromate reductase|nr:NAD(P)H-dependent oxidoreductase [Burkholderiaceae bacterium]
MSSLTIAVVVGSLRKDSFNLQVARAFVRLAPPDVRFQFCRIDDLPLFSQDTEGQPTAAVTRLKDEIKAADGVLFVTPEYNRSVPGVLKNAIDCASRPYGQGVWQNKPAGVMGVSPGGLGTALAQQHLRNVLSFFNMPTLGSPEVFLQWKEGLVTASGEIGPASKAYLQGYMDALLAWIRQHAAAAR